MRKFAGLMSVLIMLFIPVAVYFAKTIQADDKIAASGSVSISTISLSEIFNETSGKTSRTKTSSTTTEITASTEEQHPAKSKLNEPSEAKPYPELGPDDWIDVSINDQKVYFKRGNDVLYTMNCSTGLPGESATPLGEFTIETEKGETFYNPGSGEGANYWVSWRDHGVYLFHTVPIDENGNYIESEAEALGVRPTSHGCIRLSVPDAKWIYDTVPVGMRVVVRE
ncbi:L,D-transpeptidase [Enterococcus sp. AZ072]|uniref:L,D-transpeptidase n=1 Tax=unclassified Enterococcus TaxID=2608891 RepID=UPI003D2CD009